MATTVNLAFAEFMQNHVRLDADVTSRARASRNSLKAQLDHLSSNETLPSAYTEKHIDFGSFARKTKIRELDDIDMMYCMHAFGCTYMKNMYGYLEVCINDDSNPFKKFCNDGSSYVNSTKILNSFKTAVSNVSFYSRSDIHRNGESISLMLSSYGWSFDIVPCFFTNIDEYGKDYYVIPDGSGKWKFTDPRKDRERVISTNAARSANVLDAIRILKYWNRRKKIETLSSYLMENMVLDYFANNEGSNYIDENFSLILEYISKAIFSPVYDPKGIQGDLNKTGIMNRIKIGEVAAADHKMANLAIYQETQEQNHEKSINTWGGIFGENFPKWG